MSAIDDAPGAGIGAPVRYASQGQDEVVVQHKTEPALVSPHTHADPDELALIVSMMYGSALRRICMAIKRALGVNHA